MGNLQNILSSYKKKHFFFIFSLLISCGSNDKKPPGKDDRLNELKILYSHKLIEAMDMVDGNGWIVTDCDGMLWSAKLASVACDKVDIAAAEVVDGRFDRYPEMGDCRTSWSRDMGVAGLFPWAYKCDRRDVLERHATYGKKNKWIMGSPIDDLRPIYTPQMIGLLYEIIYQMGGEDSANRKFPSIYPGGLTDYKAHLQMMSIWHESNFSSISDRMLDRIKEHQKRESHNPFYNFMMGLYNGDMSRAITLLLDPSMPMSGYVRCHDERACKLSEWLFVADEVIDWYENN